MLTLKAQRPTTGLVVLSSDQPLEIASQSNVTARLRPGWDGTLGYSRYGLELTIPVAGEVKVGLRSLAPPKEPELATDAEQAAFLRGLAARPSRFPDTSESFRQWQRTYREKLAAWLMGGGLPTRVALEARVLETRDFPQFVLRRVEYRTQQDRRNTLLISLPKGVAKAPILVALHGHENPWGEAAATAYQPGNADDFCAYFAERGWAVLQPATMNHTLQHPAWTLQGEWTWDAMIALDYAATLPEVDLDRVTVCGLSTGGHLAMNLLALDDRVQAGVVGCILSTWNHYVRRMRIPPHCDCGIYGQLGGQLEQCDWAALAVPKPVQFQHGRQDAAFCPGADASLLNLAWNTGTMPTEEYAAAFAEVMRAYSLAGREADAITVYHEAEHRIDNEAAFQWLSQRLPR